jgi:tRNA nucleotidyltransferase (CCA-adding enzyme)
MGIEAAARRRDLTINSMAIDPFTHELLDPFDGLKDLEGKILRATDPDLFVEDPLRFFRVMAFTGRLGMRVDPALSKICEEMDFNGAAKERIEEEFTKLFLKGSHPSLGLRWLQSIGRLFEILPGLEDIVGLEQDPIWHPEGDVWEHTLQVVDAAAFLRIGDRDQDLMLLWAALGHDLGKVETTQVIEGRIKSPAHAERSGARTARLMKPYVGQAQVIAGAAKLAMHHLKPHDFYVNKASPRAFKRLAVALAPETNLARLADLALADHRGRNPHSDVPLKVASEKCVWFLKQAEELKVEHEPEQPVLMGRHLLDLVEPGRGMGELLRRAYEIQLNEGIKDVAALKARVLEEGGLEPE